MGKRTDTFLWLKIQLSHTLLLCAKSYVTGRASNTELLMLVSDFKVNPRLKNTQRHFQWNSWNALNGDAHKRTLSVHWGVVTPHLLLVQIA